jgi:hypothetical protein
VRVFIGRLVSRTLLSRPVDRSNRHAAVLCSFTAHWMSQRSPRASPLRCPPAPLLYLASQSTVTPCRSCHYSCRLPHLTARAPSRPRCGRQLATEVVADSADKRHQRKEKRRALGGSPPALPLATLRRPDANGEGGCTTIGCMFQAYILNVSDVFEVCCTCFIRLLQK